MILTLPAFIIAERCLEDGQRHHQKTPRSNFQSPPPPHDDVVVKICLEAQMGDRGLWTKAPTLYYSSCRESLRSVFRRCYPRENEEDVRNIRIRGNDDVTSMVPTRDNRALHSSNNYVLCTREKVAGCYIR